MTSCFRDEQFLIAWWQIFYLDERTHPTNELIHKALAEYQGPALLTYNNAVFTENDFKSLSQLGNSKKLEDGSTTGKFGRGFNSVGSIFRRSSP